MATGTMSEKSNKYDWKLVILSNLFVGVFATAACSLGVTIYANKVQFQDENRQKQRQAIFEKSAEIWRSVVAYKLCLDEISKLNSDKAFSKKFQRPLRKDWDRLMKIAKEKGEKFRAEHDRILLENSIYIGPDLTKKFAIYTEFLTAHYAQDDKVKFDEEPPTEFEAEMQENISNVLSATERDLTMAGIYKSDGS